MVKQPIAFPHLAPLTRRSAAAVVQLCSRYESRIMIEHDQKIVNAKSMLGLLSLACDDQHNMTLMVEGPDEDEAVKAFSELIATDFAGA